MKKSLFILLFSLILFSCKTYTIQEAREIIEYPEKSSIETRLKAIEDEKEKERIEEEKKKTNEYPENLEEIVYPFYYNPVKNTTFTLEDDVTAFSALLLPLGEEDLSESAVTSLKALLDNYNFTFIVLTGSLSNQVKIASLLDLDGVTFEGGTIIFSGVVLSSMDDNSMKILLTENKAITLYTRDYHPVIPEDKDTEDILALVDNLEKITAEDLIESISEERGRAKILFLSSLSPSSLDWTDWSDKSYREERSFLFSDLLLSLNWIDTYDLMRFSVETDDDYTRRIGGYEERLDFIYSKDLLVTGSCIIDVENMDTRAVFASFIYP